MTAENGPKMDQQQQLNAEYDHNHTENDAADPEKYFAEKLETVNGLAPDLGNRGAIKGDDSDGRVNWNGTQVLATIFLSGVYVGRCSI